MTHPLQTILFGTFTPPPSTNIITHRIWKDNNPNRHKAPLAAAAIQMQALLTGNKWWSVADLVDYLRTEPALIRNYLARHSKKFGIECYTDNRLKYYRIQPDVPS